MFVFIYPEYVIIDCSHTFDLKLSFHRRQNLYAMQQFLPIATAHGLIYGFFIGE